jgi:eukaryotic-like serine/threonine-protein kinase
MESAEFNPSTADIQNALPSAIVERQIARGGQKIVFKAKFEPYGDVALKLIKPGPHTRERTLRELKAASELTGPQFAKIFKIDEIKISGNDIIYIVEEFLVGETLRDRLQRANARSEAEALKIGVKILEALVKVEAADLVHRDIKPENIMLVPPDRIVLLDFGIARHLNLPSLTADLALFGPLTPGYSAPEQVKNEKKRICNRTDIFAWAIVMYECLTGQNPFMYGSTDVGETLAKTLISDPQPLTNFGVRGQLSDLIQDCLKKAIHRRPPSARVILELLEAIGG